MNRGGRTSQVVDVINLQEDGLDDVVSNELELGVPKMVGQVILPPREEIVNDDHAVSPGNQAVHQVAAHEPGPTRDHDPQALPHQPQRHPPARAHRQPAFPQRRRRGGGALVQNPPSREGCRVGVEERRRWGRGQREGVEEEGGDGDANEDEPESLPAKPQVSDWVRVLALITWMLGGSRNGWPLMSLTGVVAASLIHFRCFFFFSELLTSLRSM